MRKARAGILVGLIAFVTALLSARQMADHTRMADIPALSATGAAVGCGLTGTAIQHRQVTKAARREPSTGGTR